MTEPKSPALDPVTVEALAKEIEDQYPGFHNIAKHLREKYVNSLGSEYYGEHRALIGQPSPVQGEK